MKEPTYSPLIVRRGDIGYFVGQMRSMGPTEPTDVSYGWLHFDTDTQKMKFRNATGWWFLPINFFDLRDVTISAPSVRDIMVYSGFEWNNQSYLAGSNRLLYTKNDGTMAGLIVQASRIVLRKSSGDIIAGTATEARTILNVENGATADQTAPEIEAIVNHDNLLGFVAAEHIDWSVTGGESIHTDRYIEGGAGTDTTAIHDDTSGEIIVITEKVTPVSADVLLIEDSAASNVKKRVQIGNLPGGTPPDNSITNAKLADVSTQTIKGRTTAATGDPEDLTATQARGVMSIDPTAKGDVLIATGASTPAFVPTEAGDQDKVLTADSAAASGVDWAYTHIPTIAITSDDSSTNYNNATDTAVSWTGASSHFYYDAAETYFQHSTSTNPTRITIQKDGLYEIHVNLMLQSMVVRPNLKLTVRQNGSTTLVGTGAMGYIRSTGGHNNSSIVLTTWSELTATDYVEAMVIQEAAAGTVNIVSLECIFAVKRIGNKL